MEKNDKINLYFNNGKAYVWNAKDCLRLRKEHRIIGYLVGTSPSLSKHDNTGLPMALMAEETCLLVDKNIARLVRHKPEEPSVESQELYNNVKENTYKEQITLMRSERRLQIEEKIDHIIAGKRRKIEAQGLPIDESSLNREVQIDSELAKLEVLTRENSLVELFTENPLKLEKDIQEVSLDELSDLCPIKRRIFLDLWEKGSYITAGEKFGGHFLVYPNDPMQVHSSHIVYVCSRNERFRMTEFISLGRVAANVKKTAMYATIKENGEILYQTIRWKGL